MVNRQGFHTAVLVFLFATVPRIIGVTITTLTDLNNYARADANAFAATAEYIAEGLRHGAYVLPPDYSSTYHAWGTFLAPFWLLPGPSRIYARIGMAILGAIAVYNVYIIASHLHSRRAGIIASIPMVLYPSFVLIQSTVLREAVILFGLTTAARLLMAPSDDLSKYTRYPVVGILVMLISLFRPENFPVYVLVLGIGGIVSLEPWKRSPTLTRLSVPVGLSIGLGLTVVIGDSILDRLARLRQIRARGRTEYLGGVAPDAILPALAFSWIGAAYFLFSPFPWMVSQVMDFVAMVEGLVNILYLALAVFGARIVAIKSVPSAVALAVGIAVGSMLYGMGTANVGTAVRHRPMILWAVFLLGGVGLAHYVDWRTNTDR